MEGKQLHIRLNPNVYAALENYGDSRGLSVNDVLRWIAGQKAEEIATEEAGPHYASLPRTGSAELGAYADTLDYQCQLETDDGRTVHALQPGSQYATYLNFAQTVDDRYYLAESTELYYDVLSWVTETLKAAMRLDTAVELDALDESTLDRLGIGGSTP